MEIESNKSLKNLNTFRINAKAKYFVEIKSEEDIKELIKTDIYKQNKHFILGGGSNVLFVNDFDGLVIKNNILGIEKVKEDKEFVYIKSGAGENWHSFVEYAVKNGWGGIENLALIPGTVGASPIQNIGAYGMEIKEVVKKVETINLKNGNEKVFSNEDCKFSYRNSVFKEKYKDKLIVTYVTFKLAKTPKFNLSYKGVKEGLKNKRINLKNIKETIVKIRQSKLPDLEEIGTAGSFFKNPIITSEKLEKIKPLYPEVPSFKISHCNKDDLSSGSRSDAAISLKKYKISAGWLIEKLGYKGKVFDKKYGVYNKHSLVLVNYGENSGEKIYNLSQQIKKEVKEKYDIDLEEEVRIVK